MKKKKLNYTKSALITEIKNYNDQMKWDSYYNEESGYSHTAEPHPLEEAGEAYLDEKGFILEAVKIDGYSLKYASERLKNNRTIVKQAIKNFPHWGFEFSSNNLKKDKKLVLWCISNKYEINFWDIDKTLWDDKSLIYKYIKTFNFSPFHSGVYYYKNELEHDKKLINRLPSCFKDKNFIKKLIKIKDKSNNFAFKKAYRLMSQKNPKRDKWPR